jgi:hypothetical protein
MKPSSPLFSNLRFDDAIENASQNRLVFFSVILSPSACHAERQRSISFLDAQDQLREESLFLPNQKQMLRLRLSMTNLLYPLS